MLLNRALDLDIAKLHLPDPHALPIKLRLENWVTHEMCA
jgi:hypothetical protein